MNDNVATLLLVGDDKVNAMAVKRLFRALQIGNPIIEAGNGIEALKHLRGKNDRQIVPSLRSVASIR